MELWAHARHSDALFNELLKRIHKRHWSSAVSFFTKKQRTTSASHGLEEKTLYSFESYARPNYPFDETLTGTKRECIGRDCLFAWVGYERNDRRQDM